MRLFIAVNFPAELRRAVHADAAPLRDATPGVSWVRDANLHLTIKFLGDVADDRVGPLADALTASARLAAPFDITLEGIGGFPNLRRPRVVWMGVRDGGRLAAIAFHVDAACAALGFAREARPFRAHLTLGRVRAPVGDAERDALGRAAAGMRSSWTTTVREIDLMHSELAAGGSRYRALASAPLGRG